MASSPVKKSTPPPCSLSPAGEPRSDSTRLNRRGLFFCSPQRPQRLLNNRTVDIVPSKLQPTFESLLRAHTYFRILQDSPSSTSRFPTQYSTPRTWQSGVSWAPIILWPGSRRAAPVPCRRQAAHPSNSKRLGSEQSFVDTRPIVNAPLPGHATCRKGAEEQGQPNAPRPARTTLTDRLSPTDDEDGSDSAPEGKVAAAAAAGRRKFDDEEDDDDVSPAFPLLLPPTRGHTTSLTPTLCHNRS